MKWDVGRMRDVSVLMKIYSVVTFDQIYLAKSWVSLVKDIKQSV